MVVLGADQGLNKFGLEGALNEIRKAIDEVDKYNKIDVAPAMKSLILVAKLVFWLG